MVSKEAIAQTDQVNYPFHIPIIPTQWQFCYYFIIISISMMIKQKWKKCLWCSHLTFQTDVNGSLILLLHPLLLPPPSKATPSSHHHSLPTPEATCQASGPGPPLVGGAVRRGEPVPRACEHALLPVGVQRAGGGGRERAGGEAPQPVPERGHESRSHSGVQAETVLREQAGGKEAQEPRSCQA